MRLIESAVWWSMGLVLSVHMQFPSSESVTRADLAIRRLSPSSFPQLPKQVLFDLELRECAVPQADIEPHNVIEGRFRSADAKDWAILCSHGQRSHIRVYFDSNPNETMAFHNVEDSKYVVPNAVVFGDGVQHSVGGGFVRRITVMPAEVIRRRTGLGTQLLISHDGICDTCIGRPGYMWFFHNDQWLKLGPIQMDAP